MFKRILSMLIFFIFISCNNINETSVVYNLGNKPQTIDPHQFTEMLSVQLISTTNEGLLRQDKDGNFIHALAFEFSEKGNTLIFKIRKDAKWSDGSNVTADDVVFGFKRALNKKTAARFAELLFPIKNAVKYNKGEVSENELGVISKNDTVIITLEKPTPYFKHILKMPIAFPVKNGINTDIHDFKTALYNGPFIITQMNDDKIVLKKNRYYWDKKNIKIDKIIYTTINKFEVVENLIKNNEIDMSRVEPFDLDTKRKNKELINYQNGRIWYLDFNLKNEILSKKENRKAINEAIDREKYVKDIKLDGSTVAKSVISSVFNSYRNMYPDNSYFFDNKKSSLLEGKSIRLLAGNSTAEVKEASFIQEELRRKLNLKVNVQIVTFKERLALTRSGNYDIVLNTYSPKFDDPISMLDRWNRPNKNNYHIWKQKEYENLILAIENETNTNKRFELINKAEKILIDDVIIAPLYYSTENWYIRKNIKNVIIHPISTRIDVFKLIRENK
ncbi:peptide ABC transporter substrate-binding protein [Caviibacter abscessus]|uniref:peptide ABC transporter substrate-binding protein n=1 Tax=Caviibacter abscessus TaxID=1766719 RepID=UPI000836AA17|nr:peptide ABC transporter substrate-binding protein [Caviibacter abscessus]